MKTRKSFKKIISILSASALLLVILICALASCGSSNYDSAGDSYAGYDKGDYGITEDSNSSVGMAPGGSGIGSVPEGTKDPEGKIIKTAHANLSTEKYDEFLENLYTKISEYGGYTDQESFRTSGKLRIATISIRVPADKLETIKGELGTLGTLTYYSASKNDVSLHYASLVAEVETLTLEVGIVEELFAVAKEKGSLTDISNLESRLTDLKLRIADAQAQISVLDNKISYSTLNLTVNEVKSEKDVAPPEEKSAFERIGENLGNNFRAIGNFFVELFVWFISALPYIIIIGIIATAAIFIIIKVRKKKAKAANSEDKTDGDEI